jgi:hypothetical protein
MTGTPTERAAAIRFLTFSTTFCSFACPGEPLSAKAPPSMITSFCRSWTMSAVVLGSRVKSAICDLLPQRMYGSRRGPTVVRIE